MHGNLRNVPTIFAWITALASTDKVQNIDDATIRSVDKKNS